MSTRENIRLIARAPYTNIDNLGNKTALYLICNHINGFVGL